MDQLVSVFSRLYPEPTTDVQRADVREAIRAFVANFPHIARKLYGHDNEIVDFGGQPAHVLHLGDTPELQKAMHGFAARVGLALYSAEVGKVVGSAVPIVCRWYSNHDLASGFGPSEELVKAMGDAKTLTMGKQHVFPQFRYWSAKAIDNPDVFGCVAVFRESFAIFAGIDPSLGRDQYETALRPGFLKGFRLDEEPRPAWG